MKLKKWTPVLLSSALLTACGGSSSNDEGNTGGGNVPQPTGRAVGELQVMANQCDYKEPQTSATIIVHSENGSVVSEHQVDSEGKFDIPWTSDAKHLTTVVETDGRYSINTTMDFTTGDIGIKTSYSQTLDSRCNCEEVTIDFSDIGVAYPNHQLWSGFNILDTDTPYIRLACRVNQEAFTPMDIFVLPIDDNNVEAFGALIEIDSMDTSLVVSADIFNEPKNQAVKVNYSAGTYDINNVYSYANSIQGRRHRQFESVSGSIYSLPELNSDSFIQAFRDINLGNNESGNVNYSADRRYRIEDPNSHYELFTPTNEYQLLDDLNTMLASVGSSMSYDFSNLDSGYQAFTLSIESANMDWQVNGGLTGVIPDLALPSAIEDNLNQQIEELSLITFGYNQSSSVDELRRMWAEESRSNSYLRPAYFDNYVAERVSVNIDY